MKNKRDKNQKNRDEDETGAENGRERVIAT